MNKSSKGASGIIILFFSLEADSLTYDSIYEILENFLKDVNPVDEDKWKLAGSFGLRITSIS